ncbi:MAG: 16S rRNA (cytosine(967)-C(5))-methyltransferase RsmB [Bacillota bacterium]
MTPQVLSSPRAVALTVLHQVEVDDAYVNIALSQALRSHRLAPADRALATELAYGAVKYQLTLDHWISRLSSRPVEGLSPWVRVALRLGLYQLLFLNRIPPHAAVAETVEAVKQRVNQGAVGLVNAILRRVTRGAAVDYGDPEREPVSYLSRRYSHPEWLVDSWLKMLGRQEAEALLAANNQNPSLHLRVNTLRASRDQVIAALASEGLDPVPSPLLPEAIRLHKGSIEQSSSLKDGWAVVQDEGAMLVGRAVAPLPGEHIWDVCSAPGGKTTHMAQLMNNKGHIDATDIHHHRLEMVDRSAARLGINIIHTLQQDARHVADQEGVLYDRILVDAPCSGTGVLRRKVDARWQKSPEQIEELSRLQLELVASAARRLRSGGRLIYSTCSLEQAEDEQVVTAFLKQHAEFRPCPLRESLVPEALVNGDDYQMKLFPHIHETDGFFIASLIKH